MCLVVDVYKSAKLFNSWGKDETKVFYKILNKTENGYRTAIRLYPVQLNTMLVPFDCIDSTEFADEQIIEDGVIHAYMELRKAKFTINHWVTHNQCKRENYSIHTVIARRDDLVAVGYWGDVCFRRLLIGDEIPL